MEPTDQPRPEPGPEPVAERDAVVRRAPRYRRFVLAGVLLGLLAGFVAWLVVEVGRPEDARLGTDRLLVLWGVTVLLGGLLGAVVAVVVDARSRR